jgi:hypothetical protein
MLLLSRINVTVKTLPATGIVGVWQTFHTALKRLLVSDVIIRTCEGMTGVITILYVMNVQHFTITGDFVLLATEVNPVMKALRENGIEVTAVHSHMVTENPRLFFMHFWANPGNRRRLPV